MIINPTPVTADIFNGLWVSSLVVVFPSAERPKGMINGSLLPYDGTHLLATGGANVSIPDLATARLADPVLGGVVMNLITECKRKAGKSANPTVLVVSAPDPLLPVSAVISFSDLSNHLIPDCFTLAGTDQVFAGVFMATMAEIARQADLEIE